MINKKRYKYDHNKIEPKWQKKWIEERIYSPDINKAKRNFYNLMMFPYPSAEGLHVGNMYAFTGADIFGRYNRMKGFDVFEPIGLDGFGIHSENYALQIGKHPYKLSKQTEKRFYNQLHLIGNAFDWTKTLETYDPNYYKWTQWIFVQMFKAGLAYRKKAPVNWCKSCKTVLADEQVIGGKCERCGREVEIRKLEQWFFRITDYADRLLNNIEKIKWPEKIKIAQRNWIGRRDGAVIKFPILKGSDPLTKVAESDCSVELSETGSDPGIDVFTTRPDTLYGATFFVLAPEHLVVAMILSSKLKVPSGPGQRQSSKLKGVRKYIERAKKISKEDRIGNKGKTGVFTGLYVVNPATNKEIPVYVADYVLMDYGTGAVMGVPAHDARDWDFAKSKGLPIIEVISGGKVEKQAHDGDGKLVNSGSWNGWKMPDEMGKVIKDVEKRGWGKKTTSYHLRDWLISRQRYWGPPIPMIFCEPCAKEGNSWFTAHQRQKAKKWEVRGERLDNEVGSGKSHISRQKFTHHISHFTRLVHKDQSDWDHAGWYPVDEKELPVRLPYYEDYKPKGGGRGPLEDHPEFYKTICPKCDRPAKRETDVSDTFLDSSWYFLRYPSVTRESENSDNSEGQRIRESDKSDKPTHRPSDALKHRHTEYSELSDSLPWDPEITRQWLPVDAYIGGAEHAVLHLFYSRFVTMVFYDLKLLSFEEPFSFLFSHGLLIKDGTKMSKSRGNTVVPDEYIKKFGADTLRTYLMFLGPYDQGGDFRDTGVEGMKRFYSRVWELFQADPTSLKLRGVDQKELLIKMHQTIKKVTKDIENFRYNTAISAIMEYVNLLREKVVDSERWTVNGETSKKKGASNRTPNTLRAKGPKGPEAEHRTQIIRYGEWDQALKVLAQLLAPFAPFITEEIWQNVIKTRDTSDTFQSIHTSSWPKFDPKLVKEEKVTIVIQVDGKLRATLKVKYQESQRARGPCGPEAGIKNQVVKLAKEDQNVKKWLKGKKLKDTIFVPGKLVNFVTK